jgi:protocatechuate 3,4-dioxygenase alpha subunit
LSAPRTPSQTIGPFFAFALPWPQGPRVVPEGTAGAIRLRGRVLDGAGEGIPDAIVETWQADPEGRFGVAGFRGFGRCPTDIEGRYEIVTVKPGPVRSRDGRVHAPHVLVTVFARGLLKRVVTRLYFPDELAANEADPVLASVGDASARTTLVASHAEGGYLFDIRLQGTGETVFFRV